LYVFSIVVFLVYSSFNAYLNIFLTIKRVDMTVLSGGFGISDTNLILDERKELSFPLHEM
jgi:hypothetical protein